MEQFILVDYSTLRVIWWALLGFLLVGFAVFDGATMGVALVLPWVARTDAERSLLYDVIGPVWENGQVWLIVVGGVSFAAWPLLYAMAFSGFYLAMLLLLAALIVRPVAITYRSKKPDQRWRDSWDRLWTATGFISALVFGVAVGNVIVGVPFDFDADTLRPMYEGSFFDLFALFPLYCGVLSVLMTAAHGAAWLTWKTGEPIASRAAVLGRPLALVSALMFALGGVWVANGLDGYTISSAVESGLASNPLAKTVESSTGALLHNFQQWPLMWLAPIIGVGGSLLAFVLFFMKGTVLNSFATGASITGIVLTFGFALFPFVLPSSSNPSAGLTVWDASASHFSLWVMLICMVIFMPVILMYSSWVGYLVRGRAHVASDDETSSSHETE